MKKLILALAMAALSLALPAAHAQMAPDVLVRTTVEDVLGILKQNKDRRPLQDVVEKKVLPHFDFRSMTQLAMGKTWRDATPAQQKALENAFRTLLVRTYTTALAETAGVERKVEVKPVQLKPGEDYTTVRTVVKEPGLRNFPHRNARAYFDKNRLCDCCSRAHFQSCSSSVFRWWRCR